jgi:O-antigen ligase
VLLVAIAIAVLFISIDDIALPRSLFIFLTCLIGWIAITTAVNFDTVAASAYQDRTGLSKIVTSGMVLGFGVLVAVLCVAVFTAIDDVERLFVRPLAIAILMCGIFAPPELLTWISQSGDVLYQWTSGLFHTEVTEQGRVPGRLISLSFEAPDLAYFCGIAFPWLLFNYRLRTGARSSWSGAAKAAVPALLCVVLLALTNSRTGLVMLVTAIGAECLYWIGLRLLRLPFSAVALVVVAVVGTALALWLGSSFGEPPAEEADVSTMSRLALLTAQISIFADHPWFGVGLGQFAFHTLPSLPWWAWNSYEIVQWFESLPDLSPSFNVAGRISAELGVPGLVIWYGFWSWALLKTASVAAELPSGSAALALNAALFSSTASLISGGISNDAFRRPETWILMGITAVYAGTSEMASIRRVQPERPARRP